MMKLRHPLSPSALDENLLVRHLWRLACNHITTVLVVDDRSKDKQSRDEIRKIFYSTNCIFSQPVLHVRCFPRSG
jgi:hypothetical protein